MLGAFLCLERLKMMKKCTKCGIEKEFGEYYDADSNRDGKASQCKQCCSEARRNRLIKLICQNSKCGGEFVANYYKKLCPDCCPKNQKKILALEGKKKCSKCDVVKDLGNFHNDSSASDGKNGWCISCIASRQFNLTCQKENCNVGFTANRKNVKYCPNCVGRLRTQEEIKQDKEQGSKVCGQCLQRKDFSEFHCSKASSDGQTSICKQCTKKERVAKSV